MTKTHLLLFATLCSIIAFTSCEKLTKTETVVGNQIPYYDEVPTIKVEAYLNRMYIDLIGREPLDSELVSDIAYLRANKLSFASRDAIAKRLQTDETPRDGEGSYYFAYCHWFFERLKADLIEGANHVDFATARMGVEDTLVLKKMDRVERGDSAYALRECTFNQLVAYIIDNKVYDDINMMTFNFINATYDNLFFRYPSQNEYDIAYDVIEYNKSGFLFDKSLSNKVQYIFAMVDSREFYNGFVIRAYQKLLRNSNPSTASVAKGFAQLYADHDYPKLERSIIITDEYAQFEPLYR